MTECVCVCVCSVSTVCMYCVSHSVSQSMWSLTFSKIISRLIFKNYHLLYLTHTYFCPTTSHLTLYPCTSSFHLHHPSNHRKTSTIKIKLQSKTASLTTSPWTCLCLYIKKSLVLHLLESQYKKGQFCHSLWSSMHTYIMAYRCHYRCLQWCKHDTNFLV